MRYFLLTILIVFAFDTFSQRNVSGIVFDIIGEPLPGVIITEVEATNSFRTDIDGKFHITTLNDTTSLNFSYFGRTKMIEITQDTIINMVSEWSFALVLNSSFFKVCRCSESRRIGVGVNYDFANSMFGLSLSNGYDERPLQYCPFGFFPEILMYKVNAQTNFLGDYSFGINLKLSGKFVSSFTDFSKWRWIVPSVGFKQYNLLSQDFFHRDIYLSVNYTGWRTALTLKTGYQTLNDFSNWGATVGFQGTLSNFNTYFGASVGYYFDYFTYSAYIHGRINRNIYYRLTYDRIDNHDFLNVGLSYLFNRRRR